MDISDNLVLVFTLFSVSCFLLSLFVVPLILMAIPEDYFCQDSRIPLVWLEKAPIVRWVILICKNLFGVMIVLLGVALLFLPGQGLLTIIVGFMLLDFPGKYTIEKQLVLRLKLLVPINHLRQKAGKPPLKFMK